MNALGEGQAPVAVMIHVGNVEDALTWYQQAFPAATASTVPGFGFTYLQLADVRLEIVPADEKVSSGSAGSIVYWRVPDLARAIRHFESLGATVYRGPMQIENGWSMCQVRDPWGNCIGLRGPAETDRTESLGANAKGATKRPTY